MSDAERRARERWARGVRLAEAFDESGRLQDLVDGVSELRTAVDLLGPEHAASRAECDSALATALVRLGEQLGDISLLREALSIFERLEGGRAFADLPPDDHKRANAMAVAELRIGTLTGDRERVIAVCKGLARYLEAHSAHSALRKITAKNLVAALCENARQNRSRDVYRALIDRTSDLCETADEDERRFYLHYRATALLESSELTLDRDCVDAAIADLAAALDLCKDNLASRQTTLHSMGQAQFKRAKLSRDAEAAKAAIDYCSASMSLLSEDADPRDSRMTRLLADRGAYRHAFGVLAERGDMLVSAADDFRSARDRLAPEAAPFLFCQVQRGLFLLEYRLERFDAALSTFAALRDGWRVALADPTLSTAVLEQQAIEMVGHFTRAAYCRLMQGDRAGAVALLEAGRASNLRAASRASRQILADLPEPLAASIREAERAWEIARRGGTRDECRLAWRALLDARRRGGLDMTTPDLTEAEIFRSVPANGAVVILASVDAWTRCIAVLREPNRFVDVPLPTDAHDRLQSLLRGGDGRESWLARYDSFIASDSDEGMDEEAATRAWNASISRAQSVLGEAVFDPVDRTLAEERLAPGSRVLVAPPGELAALPLISAELSCGRRFMEKWTASIVPSLSLVDRAEPNAGPTGFAPLVVAAATESGSFAALPFVEKEIVAVERRFSGAGLRTLSGREATTARVLDGFCEADIVHIASHGQFDPNQPDASYLLLSGGERLSLDRLRSAQTRPMRLVFLSCCESGIAGRSFAPDEFVGFLPSLLQCGAAAAIGALWPVFDDAAMLFAARFYETFLDREGRQKVAPARALADAQAWLRSVTVEGLLTSGYLAEEDVVRISTSRRRDVRRRTRLQRSAAERPRGYPDDGRFDLRHRPYADPVDWAAFTLVGT